jgi:hypothetical protein
MLHVKMIVLMTPIFSLWLNEFHLINAKLKALKAL